MTSMESNGAVESEREHFDFRYLGSKQRRLTETMAKEARQCSRSVELILRGISRSFVVLYQIRQLQLNRQIHWSVERSVRDNRRNNDLLLDDDDGGDDDAEISPIHLDERARQ